jgi:TrmH family RNA methyltransferase
MIITSLQNNGVKLARSLRKRKVRDETGLSLLEGYRAVYRGFECGIEFSECYYAPKLFLGKNEPELLKKLESNKVKIIETTPDVLAKIAYRDRPEGILAIAKTRTHKLTELPIKKNGLYIVAESIEKPGNLGSILRSADAVGCDGVIVCQKRTDIYNPNVITASTGALFSTNLAEANGEEALKWLKENSLTILAATPEAQTIYSESNLTGGIALVVGAEQYGLTDFWKKNADFNVKIPMLGYIDSLNVATAATVILYEAARQRNWKK